MFFKLNYDCRIIFLIRSLNDRTFIKKNEMIFLGGILNITSRAYLTGSGLKFYFLLNSQSLILSRSLFKSFSDEFAGRGKISLTNNLAFDEVLNR